MIKPITFFYCPETPQLEIYNTMFYKSLDCLFNSINSSYLTKRSTAIKNLNAFCTKLKFRRQTYYLALLYMDLVYSKTKSNYLNLEIACLCCVLLAGIQINNYINFTNY